MFGAALKDEVKVAVLLWADECHGGNHSEDVPLERKASRRKMGGTGQADEMRHGRSPSA